MSYRLAIRPSVNLLHNFNFFFPNSKKGLRLDNDFICNVLSRRTKMSPRALRFPDLQTKRSESHCSKAGDYVKFTESESLSSRDHEISDQDSSNSGSHVLPFSVSPKARPGRKSGKNPQQQLFKHYLKLTKPNLTTLVTLSSICSYAISPNSLSIAELAFLTAGTVLCSSSANAINMGREPDFDRRMQRTSHRPVVLGIISPVQAYLFAAATGSLGVCALYFGVNPTVASLGLLNIFLYGIIYTSLKRQSILNTWVGAIVGAIPPLMGWAASTSLSHPGGWCLAALLYAWQFPHFNSLSHNIAEQYKNAGYVMTAVENPKLNARVALRYSLLMFPICIGLSYFEVVDWVFSFDSSLANCWLSFLAFKFWRQQQINYSSAQGPTVDGLQLASIQARKLFWCSVWQLPVVLVLAMLHKKGQWDRVWHYLGWTDPSHKSRLV